MKLKLKSFVTEQCIERAVYGMYDHVKGVFCVQSCDTITDTGSWVLAQDAPVSEQERQLIETETKYFRFRGYWYPLSLFEEVE